MPDEPSPSPPRRLPSGRHGLERAFVVSDQRARVLDGAGRAFAEHGFAATRIADITALAGVSRTTFYALFPDKESCFLATYETVAEILLARVAEAAGGLEPRAFEERMRVGIHAFLATLQAEPAFTRMCIVEVVAAGPRALARRDEVMRAFQAYITAGLDEAPDARPVRPLAAEVFVGGMYEAIYARTLRGEGDRLLELEDDLVEAALTLFLDRR
jgi:AcrR family transcriptional regulator